MTNMQDMPYVTGHQIRIFPSEEQKRLIGINIGAERFVYNHLVARDKELFLLRKVKIYCEPVAKRLEYLESLSEKPSSLMQSYPFLDSDDVDAQTIANGVKNYHAAWNNFRKVPGTSMPTFHKKGYAGSYQTNPHYKPEANRMSQCNIHLKDRDHVTLPKLGAVHFKDSGRLECLFARKCDTRIGTVTISRDACGDYYASFQIGSMCPFKDKFPETDAPIGIDMNVRNFYTDSNGNAVENPKFLSKETRELAKAQRKLSHRCLRAKKDNRPLREAVNYQEQRIKVAKLHRSIERRREAFQHQVSKEIVNNHDVIVAEDLKVKNLMQNHCLAKSIADCSWSSFFFMLQYKSEMYGRTFIKVPPHYTTQTCSCCGYVMRGDEHLDLNVTEWECPFCHAKHNRDHNSAQNILHKGQEALKTT